MPIQPLQLLEQRREAIWQELQEIDRLIATQKIVAQPQIFKDMLKKMDRRALWFSQQGLNGPFWIDDGIRIEESDSEAYDLRVTRSRILVHAKFAYYGGDEYFYVTPAGKEFMNAL